MRSRFAPAPTGYLHLGHLANALYVWGIARRHGAEVLLRIEDHDRQRCRPEYEAALKKNGVDYTMYLYEGVNHGFHNDTTPRYDEAAAELAWKRTIEFFKQHLTGTRS